MPFQEQDLEDLQRQKEEVDANNRKLSMFGSIGDILGSQTSVGMIANHMQPQQTNAVSNFAKGQMQADPLEKYKGTLEAYRASKTAQGSDIDLKKKISDTDPNSPASLAAQKVYAPIMAKNGMDPAVIANMSASDIDNYVRQPLEFANRSKDREMQANLAAGARKEAREQRAADYKPTEQASNAATFGRRLEQAESVFSNLEGSNFDRTSTANSVASYLPDFIKSDNMKSQEQAERNFVNALLRRESGAAIAPQEFESASKQYFPRAGDPKSVLEQKRQNRDLAKAGMKAAAGKAWELVPSMRMDAPAEKIQQTKSGASATPDFSTMSKDELKKYIGG